MYYHYYPNSALIWLLYQYSICILFLGIIVYYNALIITISDMAKSFSSILPRKKTLTLCFTAFFIQYMIFVTISSVTLGFLINEDSELANTAWTICFALHGFQLSILTVSLSIAGFGFIKLVIGSADPSSKEPEFLKVKNEFRKIQSSVVMSLSGFVGASALMAILGFSPNLFTNLIFSKCIAVLLLLTPSSLVCISGHVYFCFTMYSKFVLDGKASSKGRSTANGTKDQSSKNQFSQDPEQMVIE